MATGPGAILARVSGEVRRTGFREIRDILHASSPAHVHLRSRLTFVLGATLLVDAVASVLILLFERHAHGTQITNLGDSVFWTTTQLLTVSSQLPNPISAPARVLDVFLQAYAISVVAVLAGSWGAFFHRRSMERAPMDASDHPAS
jgi:voltage-gated potassium channel